VSVLLDGLIKKSSPPFDDPATESFLFSRRRENNQELERNVMVDRDEMRAKVIYLRLVEGGYPRSS
jgi:hypothetical protein